MMLILRINVRDMEMVYFDVHRSKLRGRRHTRVRPKREWRKSGNSERQSKNVFGQQR
jgi:hypothetical protein